VTRALRVLVLAVAALGAVGCPFWGKRPPLEQYVLVLPDSNDGVVPAGPPVLRGTLGIMPYATRGIYDERGIVFRIDDLQLSSYASREWAIPLREMLGTITEEMLRNRPLTAEPAVFDPRTPRAAEYRWRGSVREFEEVDRGRQVLAAVHLEVEIIRVANDSVVWKGAERMERAVPEPTRSMTRVVETLSALTGDVLSRLIDRARTDLGTPTAGTARVRE
jgi:ABC-type uncharacterized transport system auxiliary subunit